MFFYILRSLGWGEFFYTLLDCRTFVYTVVVSTLISVFSRGTQPLFLYPSVRRREFVCIFTCPGGRSSLSEKVNFILTKGMINNQCL